MRRPTFAVALPFAWLVRATHASLPQSCKQIPVGENCSTTIVPHFERRTMVPPLQEATD
jgi:hypothetical protein